MKVEVYLNQEVETSLLWGYRDGDRLVLAITFDVWPINPESRPWDVLEDVFSQLQHGVSDTALTQVYAGGGHRSLSVGDVVKLDGDAYAVESVGFAYISSPAFGPLKIVEAE